MLARARLVHATSSEACDTRSFATCAWCNAMSRDDGLRMLCHSEGSMPHKVCSLWHACKPSSRHARHLFESNWGTYLMCMVRIDSGRVAGSVQNFGLQCLQSREVEALGIWKFFHRSIYLHHASTTRFYSFKCALHTWTGRWQHA